MDPSSKKTMLRMATFNCRSIKRSIQCVRNLCEQCDVIALQEHWLLPHDIHFLDNIHQDFEATGKSAVDTSVGMLTGRLYGGVAILWRKHLFQSVSYIPCNNARVTAIKLAISGSMIMIISVYMPSESNNKDKMEENLMEFTECMGEVSALVENCDAECVYVLGDYNSHPNTRFYEEMMAFCADQDWLCADFEFLGVNSDTYTYIIEAHGCKRWLDHCLVTGAAWSTVAKVYVLYNVHWSDHYPIILECNLDVTRRKMSIGPNQVKNKVLWGERTPDQISKYNTICCEKLSAIELPTQCH